MRNRRSSPLSWRVVGGVPGSERGGVPVIHEGGGRERGGGPVIHALNGRGDMGGGPIPREVAEREQLSMLTRAGDRGDQCDTEQCTEQRLSISLQGQQGLGCSICKVRQTDSHIHIGLYVDNWLWKVYS